MYRYLKLLRVVVASTMIALISLAFVPLFANGSPLANFLLSIQFIPSLIRFTSSFSILFIALIALTLIFGRVYCSWICPLGIYQDLITRLSIYIKERKRVNGKKRRHRFKYGSPKLIRYPLLLLLILAYLTGLTLPLAYLDPYSIWGRAVLALFGSWSSGNLILLSLSLALLPLLVATIMAWQSGRLYCNTICPVGALLSLLSRVSLFRPTINKEQCTRCTLCASSCKAQAIDLKNKEIDASRCVGCLNCMVSCPKGGVTYRLYNPFKRRVEESDKAVERETSLDRRAAITTLALMGGAVVTKVALPAPLEGGKRERRRVEGITPPGALSVSHLKENCTLCHACIASCPSQIIKPAVGQYGLDGLLLPYLSYQNNYCLYECTICSRVCPTNAITKVTPAQKQSLKIGMAKFYPERCIIESRGEKCTICRDCCPTGAITIAKRKGRAQALPIVQGKLCIGCGECQYNCPASPDKALIIIALPVQKGLA